jgi:hypothetical protein
MSALAAKFTQAAQACLRGHPRLCEIEMKTWMAGTSPAIREKDWRERARHDNVFGKIMPH